MTLMRGYHIGLNIPKDSMEIVSNCWIWIPTWMHDNKEN